MTPRRRSSTPVPSAVAAIAALLAALLHPTIARAHGDPSCSTACEAGQVLLITVPILYGGVALATDVGTLTHLARSGSVPRGWSLAGTLLWIPPTIVSTVGVLTFSLAAASSNPDIRAGAPAPLVGSVVALVLSTASLGLQLHALVRAAPAAPTQTSGSLTPRWLGAVPWSAPSGTSTAFGFSTGVLF